MAKDADGDYYYDEGTVNELFDDIALVEESGELGVETPDGVSRVGGLGTVLGGVRPAGDVPGTDELDEGETALYTRYVTGGSEDGITLFAAHHEVGGAGDITETVVAELVAPEA